jgi:hypothetical protein
MAHGGLNTKETTMDTFPEDIRVMRIYWTVGDTRSTHKDAIPNEIRSPMTAGWCSAIVIGEPGSNQFNILDPFYLQGYAVSSKSAEMVYAADITDRFTPDGMVELILRTWDKTVRFGLGASYDMASLVLRRLEGEIPTHTTAASVSRSASYGSTEEPTEERRGRRVIRQVAERLIKPVPRNSGKGKVLQWMLDNPGSSVKALQVDLDLKKTIVGAHLFLLHRDHGIGQSYDGDAVTVVLPEGCTNPFKD